MAQASLVKWLFFSGAQDDTGNPVSSGSAYFYVPHSTSSQITVYADDAATTPLTQPVALDAGGRAQVFIKTSCEVKVLDATGAQTHLVVNGESIYDGLVLCTYGGSPTTLDAALAAVEAALVANAPSPPVDSNNVVTISTASPTFTFDATKQLNVFRATYAGDVGTLTIAWSGSAVQYARYRLVIQTGNSTTADATTISTFLFTTSPPTTMAVHTYYVADFQASDTFHLVQVTPWLSVNHLAW